MSGRRPGTSCSARSTGSIGNYRFRPSGRPGSAREHFEVQNQRRNQEEKRLQGWRDTVNNYKKMNWQATFYSNLVDSRGPGDPYDSHKQEKQKRLEERRTKLSKLLREDEQRYAQERRKKWEEGRRRAGCRDDYPEIPLLRRRLDDLKRKNDEEKRKMSDALSQEAWRRSNPQVRQMESERFNHYVREAWMDQRRWKEEERRKYEEEERKRAREEEIERQRIEEEEMRREAEKLEKVVEWKKQLDSQIKEHRDMEEQEKTLKDEEAMLEREWERLEDITRQRQSWRDVCKRKELELFWARQHQLKLKKKAANVQQELLEDKRFVEGVLALFRQHDEHHAKMQSCREEAEMVKKLMQQQYHLESLREKEYDHLFSEEAERMWEKRQAEWNRQQQMRDKLMADVMQGLRHQIMEKMQKTSDAQEHVLQRKLTLEEEMQKVHKEIERQSQVTKKSKPWEYQPARHNHNIEMVQRKAQEDQEQVNQHRQEIARLEEEMRQLWKANYRPPHFGRRKVVW